METLKCIVCNYETIRTNDMQRHTKSKKHMKKIYKYASNNPNKSIILTSDSNKMLTLLPLVTQTSEIFDKNDKKISIEANIEKKQEEINIDSIKSNIDLIKHAMCDCGKIFSHISGLSRHKRVCEIYTKNNPKNSGCHLNCKCGKTFCHSSSLSRHRQICKTNSTKEIIHLESQTDILKKCHAPNNTTENLNNDVNNNSKNNNSFNDNSIKTITNSNNKNINVYIQNHYNDALPLNMLKNEEVYKVITNFDHGKHPFVDHITFYHRTHVLEEFLGELILKEFKKSDHKKQQIWISDIPRLSFFVRCVVSKNENGWQPDKKGITFTKNVITPILNELFDILKAYIDNSKDLIRDVEFPYEKEEIYRKSEEATEIIGNINLKKLHHKILLFVAPYFQLEIDQYDQYEKITDF